MKVSQDGRLQQMLLARGVPENRLQAATAKLVEINKLEGADVSTTGLEQLVFPDKMTFGAETISLDAQPSPFEHLSAQKASGSGHTMGTMGRFAFSADSVVASEFSSIPANEQKALESLALTFFPGKTLPAVANISSPAARAIASSLIAQRVRRPYSGRPDIGVKDKYELNKLITTLGADLPEATLKVGAQIADLAFRFHQNGGTYDSRYSQSYMHSFRKNFNALSSAEQGAARAVLRPMLVSPSNELLIPNLNWAYDSQIMRVVGLPQTAQARQDFVDRVVSGGNTIFGVNYSTSSESALYAHELIERFPIDEQESARAAGFEKTSTFFASDFDKLAISTLLGPLDQVEDPKATRRVFHSMIKQAQRGRVTVRTFGGIEDLSPADQKYVAKTALDNKIGRAEKPYSFLRRIVES